jgi:hypothetical protein
MNTSKFIRIIRQYGALQAHVDKPLYEPIEALSLAYFDSALAEGQDSQTVAAEINGILAREVRRYPVDFVPPAPSQ